MVVNTEDSENLEGYLCNDPDRYKQADEFLKKVESWVMIVLF